METNNIEKEKNTMLVEYFFNNQIWYDINGIQILLKLSKSQSKKMMIQNLVDSIDYLNRKLYLKEEVLELTNLKNLREQIDIRLNPPTQDIDIL